MRPGHVDSLVDDFGRIQSEVDRDLISATFAPLVDAATECIPSALGAELSSLLLCGSIPAGRAVARRSNMDLLAVLQSEPEPSVTRGIAEVAEKLEAAFPRLVREVSISSTYVDELFNGPRSLGLKVSIRHLCVRLWGDDFAAELPKFQLTPELCASMNGDAPEVLADLWRKLDQAHGEEEHRRIAGSIARKILRTGMSCISAESGEWATGRGDIAAYLTLYFQEIAPDVEFLLHLAEQQELALVGSVQRLRRVSAWASREAGRVLKPYL